jgi:S-adenosylmethionine hydrolase
LNHFFLISDFNSSAYQIGLLKHEILNIDANAHIIDFFHHIRLNNINEAAFIAKKIETADNQKHIIIVNVGNTQQWIVYQHLTNFYILPDNGLITLILENINISNVYTFPKIGIKSAIAFCINNQLNQLKLSKDFVSLFQRKPFIEGNVLIAEVIHIDFHGNCYFNIDKTNISEFLQNSNYQIRLQHFQGVIAYKINSHISEIPDGSQGVLFSKNGYLKLVFKMGNAMKLLRIKDNTKIIIEKTS